MVQHETTRRGICRMLAGTAGAAVMPRWAGAETAAVFPDWKEGNLDIHHICTGRSESTLMVLPDGTTMLIDAGDITGERPEPTILPVTPDTSRTPAEWIAAYIDRFLKPLNRASPAVDYALMSHFHNDHIGGRRLDGVRMAHGYALSGITEVAEHIPIKKLVDRGYPDYAFPSRKATAASNPHFFDDYLAFVTHQREQRGMAAEGFTVGTTAQFALRHAPGRYPGFKIENIAANGRVGENAIFPTPDENTCSCAIKLTYGAFAYYTGGDLGGFSAKRDMETPVAAAVGRVDAMKLNHHGYVDSANPAFVAALRPRVMTVIAWDDDHPRRETFTRMTDKTIYPDERLIYTTGMHATVAERLGAENVAMFRPRGHVVIRVADGGASFLVFVLDPKSFAVLDDTGILPAHLS